MNNHTDLINLLVKQIRDQVQVHLASFNFTLSEAPSNHRFEIQPSDLFAIQQISMAHDYHFIRKDNDRQMLMFVDGACSNNGKPNARAGWAVFMGPGHVVKGRLTGSQTSNRAELQSAIVALNLRWRAEGFNSVVIASDSEYVVRGYCKQLDGWKQMGWKTANGSDVKNKDLWQALDYWVHSSVEDGLEVLFWRIPRKWNQADKYAKQAVKLDLDDA